jgi:hypothetical protein
LIALLDPALGSARLNTGLASVDTVPLPTRNASTRNTASTVAPSATRTEVEFSGASRMFQVSKIIYKILDIISNILLTDYIHTYYPHLRIPHWIALVL